MRAEYAAASDEERAALRAFLAAMGLDVDALMKGIGPAPGAKPALPKPGMSPLVQAVKALDFARTPQAVLAARSQIGFADSPTPPEPAPPAPAAAPPGDPAAAPGASDPAAAGAAGAAAAAMSAAGVAVQQAAIQASRVVGVVAVQGQPMPMSIEELMEGLDEEMPPDPSMMGVPTAAAPAQTPDQARAKWLHLQVMAGEWERMSSFLASLPVNDATGIYAHILQSMNKPAQGPQGQKPPDPSLLPEEVLAIANAVPDKLEDWQIDVLANFLKTAATKYSTGPMLASIASGTRLFGGTDPAQRERTVKFLVAAGLVVDAYGYFPPLEEARAKEGGADARAILNHGRYHQDLAGSGRAGVDTDEHLRTAWSLFGEVALIDGADTKLRQDALRRTIDLLPAVPPAQSSPWLRMVFASPTLAPAALEVISLKAVSLRNTSLDVAQRAQTILTMKEAVDTLLAQTGMDIRLVRVPLRMLTTALVGEAEAVLDGNRQQQQNPYQRVGGVAKETELLFRAMPDERWMEALEPSLASRAYRAAIGIATAADELDVAIERLDHAIKRFPEQGQDFADRFLQRWEKRMASGPVMDEDMYYFMGFVRNQVSAAPLTRGRQKRNLDRLTRLMTTLDAIGVDSRSLPSVASVFKACHGTTEVFTREGIESVFGPIGNIAPTTAASLAEQMRAGLSGDWRDRKAQQAAGMKRSAPEIAQMVERGYALAIELAERAIVGDPDSWKHAVTKAGLAYERVQFKQAEQKQDFAAYNQYRKEAFAAFAQTAERYAELVRRGEQRDDPGVYMAWFSAAVGSTELNYLTREDMLVEGSPQDDQIDLLRKSITALPADAADRHIGVFARAVEDALPRLEPEVKPRVVRHAMRIVGDHPAGAGLRRLTALYQDLVKDEIKLRLSVDGDDRIGADQRFGAVLTLRFTAAVDRETGGFSKYLQNDVWGRVGNTYRPMNYRDLLKKSIESSLGDRFEIDGMAFFDAMAPPRPVSEGGDDGWLEKPVTYLVLRAKDPSVDRLPQVTMDMHFNDTVGPVVLPVMSNAPPLDASSTVAEARRPMRNLDVTQTIDLRDLDNGDKDRAVTLEVQAKAEGVVPELDVLLPGFRDALPGYEVTAAAIEARPINVVQADESSRNSMYFRPRAQEKAPDYILPDDTGTYRLATERSWMITYKPTDEPVGGAFTMPTLAAGIEGKLSSRQFADMDVVPVTTATIDVKPTFWSSRNLILAIGIAAMAVVALAMYLRRRRVPVVEDEGPRLPSRITPMSVIAALRRMQENGAAGDPARRQSLEREIAELEQRYFGRAATEQHDGDLRATLQRWVGA